MRQISSVLLFLVTIVSMSTWIASAHAADLEFVVCEIIPTHGSRSISKANVKKFFEEQRPSVAIDDRGSNRIPFMYEEAKGCLVAKIPDSWRALYVVYSFDGNAYEAFPTASGAGFDIVKDPVKKKGSVLWVDGGLKAEGAPVAAMLLMLSAEAASLAHEVATVLSDKKKPLERSMYLDLQSFAVGLQTNLALELADAEKRFDQLNAEVAEAQGRAALLAELALNDAKLGPLEVAARNEVRLSKETLTKFSTLVDAARKALAAVEAESSKLSAAFSQQQSQDVADRVAEVVREAGNHAP